MSDTPPDPYPGEFVRVVIGSTIHGLNVPGTDDLDLMGVCVEPPEAAVSMRTPFEQHTYRTQPEGVPSGVGDIDLSVYSLRKFLKLASNGNPTVINLLFVAAESRHIDSPLAEQLRDLTPLIISRECATRYLGYLKAQKERLLGERGGRHGAQRRLKYLSPDGAWDTKYAMHMIRLGVQGVELLRTGRIVLPMQDPIRSRLFSVRQGQMALEDCVAWAEALEGDLLQLRTESPLAEHPDRDTLNDWLVQTYVDNWTLESAGRRLAAAWNMAGKLQEEI